MSDLPALIQSLLLDPKFVESGHFFLPQGTRGREYTRTRMVNVSLVQRYGTATSGQISKSQFLFLIIHSDKTVSMKGIRFPYRSISLGNFRLTGNICA